MVWGALAAAAVTAAASIYSAQQANKQNVQNSAQANALNMDMFNAQRQDNLNYFQATQNFNREEAERARAYGLELSGTAYQRAMADMKSAGLNPMLAYQQGGASQPQSVSASSPGQSAPGSFRPSVPQVHQVVGPALQAGLSAAQGFAGLEQTEALTDQARAQTANIAAEEKRTRVDTLLRAAETGRASADTERLVNSARVEAARVGLVGAEEGRARAETGLASERERGARQEREITERVGRPGAVGSALSSADAVRRQAEGGFVGDLYRWLNREGNRAMGSPALRWRSQGSGGHAPRNPSTPSGGTMDFHW